MGGRSGCSCRAKIRPKDVEFDEKQSFLKNVSYYFAEFCQNTSLHGLKFLGEKGRSIFEKLCWAVVIVVSFYICAGLIRNVYAKWKLSPVIVNFATTQTPIFQIPFPAVTICPETKSNRSVFNFTDIHLKYRSGSLTADERRHYEYMTLICVNKNELNISTVDERLLDFMAGVAPDIDQSVWKCRWMGRYTNCNDIFVPVLTEEGVCFSFNTVDREEMFSDDVVTYKDFQKTRRSSGWSHLGYYDDDDVDSYPQRALFSSVKAGLALTLQSFKKDVDDFCSAGMQGYKVHLHHPMDFPSIGEHYFRVPLDEAVVVAIKPREISTNEKLSVYLPEHRQCYFPEEKPLRYFKIYSQQNCHVECLTNFTLKFCGCVGFYMPRTPKMPICGAAKRNCAIKAEALFMSKQVSNKLKRLVDDIPGNDFNISDSCDCLPSCTSITYEEETSQTPWDWQRFYTSEELQGRSENEPIHNSKLTIYFKDRQVMPSQRNELYGLTDFIANCGGLLGLFVGFSFISLVEMIYFVTLRLACNLSNYGKRRWSGSPDLAES